MENKTVLSLENKPVDAQETNIIVIKATHKQLEQTKAKQPPYSLPLLKEQMEQCKFALNKHNLTSVVINNDSMEPTYKQNDIVVVDLDSGYDCDGFYLVRAYGQEDVCRLQLMLNGYRLIYDNTHYDNVIISNDDDFEIVGRIYWQLCKTY
jgi:hypothetical protein